MPREDHHCYECPHIPLQNLLCPIQDQLGIYVQKHLHVVLSEEGEVVSEEVWVTPLVDLIDDNFFARHNVVEDDDYDVGGQLGEHDGGHDVFGTDDKG